MIRASRVPFSSCLRAACSARSEEHTSELQSRQYLVCRLLLEKKKRHLQVNSTHEPLLYVQQSVNHLDNPLHEKCITSRSLRYTSADTPKKPLHVELKHTKYNT